MIEQLSLFEESKEEKLQREMKTLQDKFEKFRRTMFAREAEFKKMYHELKHEYEWLKLSLCKGKIT